MMKATITGAALLIAALLGTETLAQQAEPQPEEVPVAKEKVQSDISMREVAIQSNFTGIEILIFGSIDFSDAGTPGDGQYDVIAVVRGPDEPAVLRRKQRVAGIWVNGPGVVYSDVPSFYAVLSTRPFRAIASDTTLEELGIGFANLGFGRNENGDPREQANRSALIRLKEKADLFQEDDDGVAFIGRSLFRTTVALPVNVPTGRYTVDTYLFRGGVLASKSQGSLQVTKTGFEGWFSWLAANRPFLYGLLSVTLAVMMGLFGWYAFRRD